MRIRTTLNLMSAALAVTTALLAWQIYGTHQLRQELSALKESRPSVAPQLSQNSPSPLGSNSGTLTPPPASAPVNPPNTNDPFAGFFDDDFFSGFDQMRQRMEQLMNGGSLFDRNGFSFSFSSAAQPEIEMREEADAYVVTIELPEGSSNVELNTEVEDGKLNIAGKLTVKQEDKQGGRSFSSVQTQQFSRSLPLPKDVDPLGIRNETQGNQVVVTLPKSTG